MESTLEVALQGFLDNLTLNGLGTNKDRAEGCKKLSKNQVRDLFMESLDVLSSFIDDSERVEKELIEANDRIENAIKFFKAVKAIAPAAVATARKSV